MADNNPAPNAQNNNHQGGGRRDRQTVDINVHVVHPQEGAQQRNAANRNGGGDINERLLDFVLQQRAPTPAPNPVPAAVHHHDGDRSFWRALGGLAIIAAVLFLAAGAYRWANEGTGNAGLNPFAANAGFNQNQKLPRVQRHSEFTEGQDYCNKYVSPNSTFLRWVGAGMNRRAICG